MVAIALGEIRMLPIGDISSVIYYLMNKTLILKYGAICGKIGPLNEPYRSTKLLKRDYSLILPDYKYQL
jgi:hypothetical protein